MSELDDRQEQLAEVPQQAIEEALVDLLIAWAIRAEVHPSNILMRVNAMLPWDEAGWDSFVRGEVAK